MSGVTPSADALFDGVPLEQPPSNRQGFGRLQLSNSLPLAGATRRLQVNTGSGALIPPCSCEQLLFRPSGAQYQ